MEKGKWVSWEPLGQAVSVYGLPGLSGNSWIPGAVLPFYQGNIYILEFEGVNIQHFLSVCPCQYLLIVIIVWQVT